MIMPGLLCSVLSSWVASRSWSWWWCLAPDEPLPTLSYINIHAYIDVCVYMGVYMYVRIESLDQMKTLTSVHVCTCISCLQAQKN